MFLFNVFHAAHLAFPGEKGSTKREFRSNCGIAGQTGVSGLKSQFAMMFLWFAAVALAEEPLWDVARFLVAPNLKRNSRKSIPHKELSCRNQRFSSDFQVRCAPESIFTSTRQAFSMRMRLPKT